MGLKPASVRPCVRPSVRPSVRVSTISNVNLSETSRPIKVKFHLKHHWDGESATLGYGLDWIKSLVDMATDSSHSVIKEENIVTILAPSFLIGSSLFL